MTFNTPKVCCKQCGFDEKLTGPLINGYCQTCIEDGEDALDIERCAQEMDAMKWLERDLSVEPTWFSKKLNDFVGPIMPGLTLLCARPSNGKTTAVCNQIIHSANQTNQKVLVFCLETPAGVMRLSLAAIECGFNPGLVRVRDWSSLPDGAMQAVVKKMGEQSARWGKRLRIVDDDRISLSDLLRHLNAAHADGYSLVILDHLHEVAWGDNPDNVTADMTEGMHKIREILRSFASEDKPLRLLAACQLKRPSGYDVLEEYMQPPPSAIKQSGAAEEVAPYVYMLYRALKDGVTAGDLKAVRDGQMPLTEVAEDGAMNIAAAKQRDRGQIKGHHIKLWVQDDRILDDKPTSGWKSLPSGGNVAPDPEQETI